MLGSLVFSVLVIFIGNCMSVNGGDVPYVCTLGAEHGPCQPFVAIPRYHYNATSGQCELFYYGGCEGNQNNFKTIAECQQCCPTYTSKSCPTVNIKSCENPLNSVAKTCLGKSQITQCGTACPKICGQPIKQVCTEQCLVGVCQCPPDSYRRLSDCQCVKQEEC